MQGLVISTEEKVESGPNHEQGLLKASKVTEELHNGHDLAHLDLLLFRDHDQSLVDVIVFFVGYRRSLSVSFSCKELGELRFSK